MKKPPARKTDKILLAEIQSALSHLQETTWILEDLSETIASKWKQRKKDRTK